MLRAKFSEISKHNTDSTSSVMSNKESNFFGLSSKQVQCIKVMLILSGIWIAAIVLFMISLAYFKLQRPSVEQEYTTSSSVDHFSRNQQQYVNQRESAGCTNSMRLQQKMIENLQRELDEAKKRIKQLEATKDS